VRLVRVLVQASIALFVFGVASASAGEDGIASFEPKIGGYAGTLRAGGKTNGVSGTVTRSHGGYYVQVRMHALAHCSDQTERPVKLDQVVRLRGKEFTFLSTHSDPQLGGGRAVYKITGMFSRGGAFSGSAVKEGGTSALFCNTGRLYFSLEKN
jgi:hypothetical protein